METLYSENGTSQVLYFVSRITFLRLMEIFYEQYDGCDLLLVADASHFASLYIRLCPK